MAGKFKHQDDKRWTSDMLDKNPGITEHQLEFILWNEQFYKLHGMLPDYETTEPHITLSEEQWRDYWLNRNVREAIISRGIPLRLPSGMDKAIEGVLATAPILTGRQLRCVDTLLDFNDTRAHKTKLHDLGITSQEFQTWLADPTFNEYYQQRSAKVLKDGSADADQALLDNVRMGDTTAIKYFNEMTGRYRPQDPQVVNFNMMVNQIIDILAEELTPELQQRVAGRILRTLEVAGMGPQGLTGQGRVTAPVGSQLGRGEEVVKYNGLGF